MKGEWVGKYANGFLLFLSPIGITWSLIQGFNGRMEETVTWIAVGMCGLAGFMASIAIERIETQENKRGE